MKLQGILDSSMFQTHPLCYSKLIHLSLLIVRYLQELKNECNPELVAFMMDHSNTFFTMLKNAYGKNIIRNSCYESIQAFLCEKAFRDYAECKLPGLLQWILLTSCSVLECNTLQLAILQRNGSQVEDIIKVSTSTVHFQNTMGQSPLHLAADWPWATVLLLTNGADTYQVDRNYHTAIDYACGLKNYEVVKILLEAGSPLSHHGPLRDIIECSTIYYHESLFKLIISHLAIRRRELLQIAQTLLPEATLYSIMPPNETVPDSSAYNLITAVCNAGLATKPDYWYDSQRGLYQSYDMFPAAADIIYEEGFQWLEGRDLFNNTPISNGRNPVMILWLYRKGVSFTEWTTRESKQYPSTLIPPIYSAIEGLMPPMYSAIDGLVNRMYEYQYTYDKISLRKLDGDIYEVLQILLQDRFSGVRDSCQCPCGSGGCSPEDMILKGIQMRIDHVDHLDPLSVTPLPHFVQVVDDKMMELHGKLAPSSFSRLSQAAIRMVLFLDLGIRHHCCKVCGWAKEIRPTCQEEADEIRMEDSLLVERFEALLPKAQLAWEKSSKGLTKFWREFHRANICSRRNGSLDEKNLKNMRELGVTLHERDDEEMYCDSLYGDEEGYCESLSDNEEGSFKSLDSDDERDLEHSSP